MDKDSKAAWELTEELSLVAFLFIFASCPASVYLITSESIFV